MFNYHNSKNASTAGKKKQQQLNHVVSLNTARVDKGVARLQGQQSRALNSKWGTVSLQKLSSVSQLFGSVSLFSSSAFQHSRTPNPKSGRRSQCQPCGVSVSVRQGLCTNSGPETSYSWNCHRHANQNWLLCFSHSGIIV